MVKLGDIARPSGKKAGAVEAPVYAVTKSDGFVRSDEYFKKQVYSRDTSGYKLVEPGEFAYATIHLDEGSIGIAPERALISPMYTVFTINTDLVYPKYLIRFLKSDRALSAYQTLGAGSAHRRKSISFKSLSSLQVPLPPLDEQRRIATILDSHQQSIRGWRYLYEKLARVEDSIFNSVFSGAKRAGNLGDLIESLQGGKSVVGTEGSINQYRVLKISATTSGVYREDETKPLPDDFTPIPESIVKTGDVLISRANTSELVGASALVTETNGYTTLPDKLWRATPKPGIDPLFLHRFLSAPETRREISRSATGSGGSMKNISKGKLLSIPAFIPSESQQREFGKAISHSSKIRSLTEKALASQEELTHALQSRAFRGEL